MTIADVEQALYKIYYARYTNSMAFAFYPGIMDGDCWLLNNGYRFNGKKVVVMSSNGKIHKLITEFEEKYNIHFDRIDEMAAQDIYRKSCIMLCDEEGEFFPLPSPEPPVLDALIDFNPWRK